jgi:hypothetical protein
MKFILAVRTVDKAYDYFVLFKCEELFRCSQLEGQMSQKFYGGEFIGRGEGN